MYKCRVYLDVRVLETLAFELKASDCIDVGMQHTGFDGEKGSKI